MRKIQTVPILLLLISIWINGWLVSAQPDEPKATTTEPPQRKLAQQAEPDFTRAATGLTKTESQHLQVAQINSVFTHERDELRAIRDPWLTMDEIHREGLGRFEKIMAAEHRRRDALEKLSGKHWSRIDLEAGWSRFEIFLNTSAAIAGQTGEAAYTLNSIVAEGAREVGLAKSNPFDISTPTQADEIQRIVLRQEQKIREQLDDEQFEKFFTPFVMMTVEDVRHLGQRFGREATEQEQDFLAAYFMPKHPLAEIIHRTTVSGGNFSPELLQILRPMIGDEAFGHLLENQNAFNHNHDFEWDQAKRVQVFDLEMQRDRVGMEAILNEEHLEKYRASKQGAWMSEMKESSE